MVEHELRCWKFIQSISFETLTHANKKYESKSNLVVQFKDVKDNMTKQSYGKYNSSYVVLQTDYHNIGPIRTLNV